MKDATKEAAKVRQPSSKPLAERLEARRQELTAKTPFGLGLAGSMGIMPSPLPEQAESASLPKGVPVSSLLNDDDPDESEETDMESKDTACPAEHTA